MLSSHLRMSRVPSRQQQQQRQPHLQGTELTSLDLVTDNARSSRKRGSRPNGGAPVQHPSRYPLSAIYALQQPETTFTSACSSPSRPPSRFEVCPSSTPVNGSRHRTMEDNSTTFGSQPPIPESKVVTYSTPTTSERPTSQCSGTSSEFSLTLALPPLSIPASLGIKLALAESSKRSLPANFQSLSMEIGKAVSPTTQLKETIQTQRERCTRFQDPCDSEESTPPKTKTPTTMKLRKKSIQSAKKASKRVPFVDSTSSQSNVAFPTWSDNEAFRPTLRRLSLASRRATRRSPPPPFTSRIANVPPSPMTPKQITRPTTVARTSISDNIDHHKGVPEASVSLEETNVNTLPIGRPPRSMKRCPTPIQAVEEPKQPTKSNTDKTERESKESFDYHDGIQWEMLNETLSEGERDVLISEGVSFCEKDKWTTIELWRDCARLTQEDTLQVDVEQRSPQDEPWDETLREIRPPSPLAFTPLDLEMPSSAPSMRSLCPADSFQSMSSFAQSVFTALLDSPAAPACQTLQDHSSITQDQTPDVNFASRDRTSNCIVSVGNDQRQIVESQHSGEQEMLTRIETVASGSTKTSELCDSTTHPTASSFRHSRTNPLNLSSPENNTVQSDPSSELFESADEGAVSPRSPDRRKNSPREQLVRHLNAQRRASRLFGRCEMAFARGGTAGEEEEPRRRTEFSLSATQLMALSEEAESGLLDAAQLQTRHARQLITTDDDTSPNSYPTSDSMPVPDLSRLSQTSREDEVLKTPKSPIWQVSADKENIDPQFGLLPSTELYSTGPSVSQLVPNQPIRPARRRSRPISTFKGHVEETSFKPVTATFVKLNSLPIQLVEAPTQSSWRSAQIQEDFEVFSNTFGSKEMHRQEVIEELIVTEWNFVISLSSILRVFSLPLRNSDLSFLEYVPLEVARLFNCLDDILTLHIKMFKSLDKVRNRHPSSLVVRVAEAISKHIEGLSVHQTYLVNFEKVTKLLEEIRRSTNKGELSGFDEVIERQSSLPECRGMRLTSFLLKPVQRLMKYPLFFKQLAELTPSDHPDYQQTQQLCSLTERVIRDMNSVKAREEDYQELKLLEGRVKGLPDGFHLASRQRRLLKQGSLRSVIISEMDRLMMSSVSSTSFNPPTPTLPYIRPLSLISNNTSNGLLASPRSSSGALLLSPQGAGQGASQTPSTFGSVWSPSLSEASSTTSFVEARSGSIYSTTSSSTTPASFLSDVKKGSGPSQPPPPRPASRKTSMANLFSRGQTQSNKSQIQNETEDEIALHAFVFDDLLLLTTRDKDEEKETLKTYNKTFSSKKKTIASSRNPSPTLTQGGFDDNAKYNVISRGGLSRILGVTSRVAKGEVNGLTTMLEVEVLPLYMVAEGLRSSGSSGSITFVFSFAEESKTTTTTLGHEMCQLWEKAFERSFLSCIQAQKKQSKHAQLNLSSPIFGANNTQRPQASPTTAQTDWLRRRRHVTQVVTNAAKCGDRTTLTALLQAGLPFPRSPSQQNLSDTANRTVAIVERGPRTLTVAAESSSKETKTIRKSASQSHLQALKRSPVLASGFTNSIDLDEVARVGDLGSASLSSRTLDEERREEKTWWSLRLREIEAEAGMNDELERLMGSRRSRVVEGSSAEAPAVTRVRRGIPVRRPLER